MVKRSLKERTGLWIGLIALGNVALHLAFYNTLEFHRDELLYFSLGRHLSAGYASVPPFTGLMAFIMTNTIGSTLFAARLLPALFSGLLVILVTAMTREMKGNGFARILAAIGVVVLPLNLRGFFLFQPVFLDVIFWTLFFYIVILWINTKKDIFLVLLGIVSGIGIMNKYLIILQIFCVAGVFLLSAYRQIFKSRSLYVGVLLAFMIILPNVIWQASNGFPVITHMKALNESQLVNVNRYSFLAEQLLLGFMAMILIIPGILFILFSKKMKSYRPLVISVFIVIFILFLLRGKSYYTAGLYPFMIAAGGVFWGMVVRSSWMKTCLIVIMVGFTIPFIPMGIPVFRAERLASYFQWMKNNAGMDVVLRDERGNYHALPQDYSDMIGWEELTANANKAYRQVTDKSTCFLYCENYGQAGAITVLGKKYGLPEPVCFSESFYYWAPKDFPVEIKSAIYINDEPGEDIRTLFRDVREIGRITNPLAREYGTAVYLCRDPVSSFNVFYKERIVQVVSPF
jgi:hypothetical protein